MKLPIAFIIVVIFTISTQAQLQQAGIKIVSSTTFSCTATGYFPDVNNASRFLFCTRVGNSAAHYQCPPKYIYNPKLFTCQLTNSPIECTGHKGELVAFPVNPAYYAWCPADGSAVTNVFKCPNEVDQYYDMKTNRCEYRCTTIGNFADRMDCTRYYVCDQTEDAGQFVAIRQQCPTSYHYSNHMCVAVGPQKCVSKAELEEPKAP